MVLFFFVGGLERQVRQVLKTCTRKCINVGRGPNWWSSKRSSDSSSSRYCGGLKKSLMRCSVCRLLSATVTRAEPLLDVLRCVACGGAVESTFRFCPLCGAAL